MVFTILGVVFEKKTKKNVSAFFFDITFHLLLYINLKKTV